MTNLTELNLWETQVSDVSPLANLTNLTQLNLRRTQVSDVSPLANLTNLKIYQSARG
ncbi:leucine-rich repeat domain-containing protein [Nostoc sp.]|uniref:leucine-rich repeat domain-containing protein n=1 Tax=Nostoc sp. TaxID=1180 RepID=UPI002FF9EA44